MHPNFEAAVNNYVDSPARDVVSKLFKPAVDKKTIMFISDKV